MRASDSCLTGARLLPRPEPPRALPSRARRTRDCEQTSELAGAASHRVEPEVTGMVGIRIEPVPVVADLDEHPVGPGLDPNGCSARAGMLHDVGERLSRNAEQLSLGLRRQPGALRAVDVDQEAMALAERRSVFGKRRGESVCD